MEDGCLGFVRDLDFWICLWIDGGWVSWIWKRRMGVLDLEALAGLHAIP